MTSPVSIGNDGSFESLESSGNIASSAALFLNDGNLLILNLLVQITVLAAVSLIVAGGLKRHAALRYSMLFAALLGIFLLSISSVILQSRSAGLFTIPIELPGVILSQSDRSGNLPVNSPGLADFEIDATSENPLYDMEKFSVKSGEVALLGESLLNAMGQLPVAYYLVCVWLLGLLVTLFGLGRGLHLTERVRRQSNCLTVAQR